MSKNLLRDYPTVIEAQRWKTQFINVYDDGLFWTKYKYECESHFEMVKHFENEQKTKTELKINQMEILHLFKNTETDEFQLGFMVRPEMGVGKIMMNPEPMRYIPCDIIEQTIDDVQGNHASFIKKSSISLYKLVSSKYWA